MYSILIYIGEGGGELNQREVERGNRGENRSQSLVENTNMSYMTDCPQEMAIPVYKL
jgi:hypothetical protein